MKVLLTRKKGFLVPYAQYYIRMTRTSVSSIQVIGRRPFTEEANKGVKEYHLLWLGDNMGI